MTLSDPIADLLTRLRNASTAKHKFVDISWSVLKEEVIKVLLEKGYIKHYLVSPDSPKRQLRVYLKYGAGRQPVISTLKRHSKPGVRKYVTASNIPSVLGGLGDSVLSTSKGVMSGEKARKENVGGELLCLVW